MIIIGIDPDTEKSGVCIINTQGVQINSKVERTHELRNMNLIELIDLIRSVQQEKTVIVENSWTTQSGHDISVNYHSSKSCRTACKIAYNVGANHEIGKQLIKMFDAKEYYSSEAPFKANPKYSHEDYLLRCKAIGLTATYKQTNQEQRDAFRAAYYFYNTFSNEYDNSK